MPPALHLPPLLCYESANTIRIVVFKLALEVLPIGEMQDSPAMLHILEEIT